MFLLNLFSVEFDKFKLYSCPIPCVMDSFNSKTSFSRFPVNEEADEISSKLNLNGTVSENHQFLRYCTISYFCLIDYEFLLSFAKREINQKNSFT